MKVYTDTPSGTTVIQNIFIDQYMPKANGEFIKVYLYLLRCADSDCTLTLSSIADVLEHTENDVRRALTYWEKQGLLQLQLDRSCTLDAVTFVAPHTVSEAAASLNTVSPIADTMSVHTELPVKTGSKNSRQETDAHRVDPPSRERILAISEQQDMKQLFFIAEQYLQRPLTPSEQSDFIYYYDTLKFSADLIEYLLEYCISKGSPSRHYIRKVALSWAEAGITTVLQAKQESNLYNKHYFAIFNAFGIKGRNPVTSELETMSRWLKEYCFSMDIILEACKRTISQIHQPSFQYADKILKKWNQNGVKTLSDIEKLDLQRKKDQKKQQPAQQKPQSNRFNNFSQREYDYPQLERQLLNQ